MKTKFYCNFPGCQYSTNKKSAIHIHHIVPRALGGSNKKYNLIYLCQMHHSLIYVPEAKEGIHSIRLPQSIILNGWKMSTNGFLLEYINQDNNVQYYNPNDPSNLNYIINNI